MWASGRRTKIDQLFPEDVVTVMATPEMWDAPLYPEEAKYVARAVDRRRREFAAGRACARIGLERLGIRDFPLEPHGEDRSPIWPAGIAGSISHTAGACGLAVVRVGAIRSVGYDIERATPLKPHLRRAICTPGELERLASISQSSAFRDRAGRLEVDWYKLVFSAKESFYKCYFPLTRTFLGFQDAEIDFMPDQQEFVAHLVKPDAPAAEGHREFRGCFAWGEDHVATGVTLFRTPPRSTDKPS